MVVDGLNLPGLQEYFGREVPEVAGPLAAQLIHGGRSNLTYLLTDGVRRWVLRRPPLGGLTPSAHDMTREFRVIDALRDSGVPVAHAVALCEDTAVIGAPFSVMSYVDGVVLRGLADLEPVPQTQLDACAHALMVTLAKLHRVSPSDVGLAGFGRPEGYLGRQVRRWADQWSRIATRDLPDIERLRDALADATPPESGSVIVHGDFRLDNAILCADRLAEVRAIVDWEMSTLGDPLADVGLALVYRDPAFAPVLPGAAACTSDRMPGRDAMSQSYASASGRDLSNLDFYLALGYFKIAVIAEGIHARHRSGETVGEGFETVGSAVPELAAAGLRALNDRSTK
ncbi:acyl-CoA dehydrogenase [Rhizocola hellebori]|uniref:Acyl-CoA dehydrogenase n=1 Tax=Rhizocola hellebori TaxID=1392758 RepID=A0A8J3Q420_9ACTN|nr:phosphotransferase family protein [Rhizocola hellebori]GIH03006.1 acyl-CoA dehydrogenase [Rhizocola hellebori]